MAATAITEDVFEARDTGSDQLPKAAVELLPLDEKAEAGRAARVEQGTGSAPPGLVRDTADVLFRDLRLRLRLLRHTAKAHVSRVRAP